MPPLFTVFLLQSDLICDVVDYIIDHRILRLDIQLAGMDDCGLMLGLEVRLAAFGQFGAVCFIICVFYIYFGNQRGRNFLSGSFRSASGGFCSALCGSSGSLGCGLCRF